MRTWVQTWSRKKGSFNNDGARTCVHEHKPNLQISDFVHMYACTQPVFDANSWILGTLYSCTHVRNLFWSKYVWWNQISKFWALYSCTYVLKTISLLFGTRMSLISDFKRYVLMYSVPSTILTMQQKFGGCEPVCTHVQMYSLQLYYSLGLEWAWSRISRYLFSCTLSPAQFWPCPKIWSLFASLYSCTHVLKTILLLSGIRMSQILDFKRFVLMYSVPSTILTMPQNLETLSQIVLMYPCTHNNFITLWD